MQLFARFAPPSRRERRSGCYASPESRAFERPGSDLLSHALRHSTIGAEGLNGRVRNGIGCVPLAITTRPFKRTNPEPARACARADKFPDRQIKFASSEFRFARVGCRQTFGCFAPPSAQKASGCYAVGAFRCARDLSRASLHESHISSAARQCRRVMADARRPEGNRGASNKPIERLGPVSSAPYGAYTPGLSTWWSTTALKGYLVSREASRLDAFSGYPVRT